MTTYQTEDKEQRLMIIIVLGQKYYLVFHNGQFLIHVFLVFSWRISFLGVKIQILQVMQTIVRPFTVENNIDNVIVSLEQVSHALFNWFKNNRLKYNVDKYHVLISTNKPGGILKLETTIDNSECKKLLAVKIDVNLNFNDLISEMYKKASRKIFAFARVTPFMGLSK